MNGKGLKRKVQMKQKLLQTTLAVFILVSCSFASFTQAGIIALDDWWLQTDGAGGFRQNVDMPTEFLAVAKFGPWDLSVDSFEIMEGYHWATWDEHKALFNAASTHSTDQYYSNNEGWVDYMYDGVYRDTFLFADVLTNPHYINAISPMTWIGNSCVGCNLHKRSQIAGLVIIKDAKDVPEPSTLAIFALGIIGLASRRFKKQS
jgi:hypothetical protein